MSKPNKDKERANTRTGIILLDACVIVRLLIPLKVSSPMEASLGLIRFSLQEQKRRLSWMSL